ncbi:unnamed protein product [Prunus armeniaca]|uniref:Uncharacterized protein n=1 Tax=Prunus armeniaca TaxID=36596 RepID=A0A6J5VTS2_PRUAR|nr:unnamed protein product [Prunus armeniaca]CAB4319585.1 unnamed protein product [Prunus armeniaca]
MSSNPISPIPRKISKEKVVNFSDFREGGRVRCKVEMTSPIFVISLMASVFKCSIINSNKLDIGKEEGMRLAGEEEGEANVVGQIDVILG